MKLSILIVLLTAFSSVACSQQLIDISNGKELRVDIEHLGNPGKLKKYLVENGNKPIEPPIPNAYQFIEKKYYKIETDIIAYGDTIFTFHIPAAEGNLAKVKILHLTVDEMSQNGFVWQDCTLTSEKLENQSAEKVERLKKFLPDAAQKMVSCKFDDAMKREEYFVAVLQTKLPPTEPFTKITWSLDSKTTTAENGGVIYKLTLTNAGTKDIGELNFRSMFDTDTRLNSIKPSQGTCRASNFGFGAGSAVCYAGKIPAGQNITVTLEGENSGMDGNPLTSHKKNEGWMIAGFVKGLPNDPIFNANSVAFEPITKVDLTQTKK